MKNNFILPTLLLSTGITLAQHNHSAEHTSEATHLGHADHDQYTAPIGVMGAHNHEKGKWMFSYRYMYMSMDDNYDGSDTVSDQQVLQDFMVTPTDMNMEMHMFGAMYGVTDKLTIMGMVNYVNLEMSHLTRMGGTFTTRSQGLGDSSINAIYNFHSGESSQALAGLGIGLPTAKTDREDFIPAVGRNTTLPFPMQLGSGSWAIRPSLTYNGYASLLSWGAQVSGVINVTDNDSGYRLGDSAMASLWSSFSVNQQLNASLRLQGSIWDNIDGIHEDFEIPQAAVPTVRPDLRGGQRVDLFAGASYAIPHTTVRFAGEFGKTLWQDLDGPQLGTDFTVNLGIQASY